MEKTYMLQHEFTENNHFKWGYNGEFFNKRKTGADTYHVDFGKTSRPVNSFKEECYDVARKIYEYGLKIDKTPDLMFSGGSESEMMVRSFVEQGLPANVHIMVFEDHLNLHDISHAIVYCEREVVPYKIHRVNIEEVLKNKGMLLAAKANCITPRMLPHIWLLNELKDGFPIMGMGECYIAHEQIKAYYDIKDGTVARNDYNEYHHMPWYLYEREKINSWYRYCYDNDIAGVPGFFQYTPEIMLSFLEEDITKELANCEHKGKLSNTSTKLMIYEKHFPDILQRTKRDGFERLTHIDRELRKHLIQTYGIYSQEYLWEYNDLVRHLRNE